MEHLEVDPDTGLSHAEVERRRGHHGPNKLADPRPTPWWRILWDQLANLVVVLLFAAAAAGFLIGEVIEAAAILVVLVVNTVVGFLTEYQSSRSMASLRRMVETVAEVEREDRRDEIDASGLVPGDIVRIEAGEHVPADIRLLGTEDLQAEESALTGESEAVRKESAVVAVDAPLAERTDMLFMGTTVVGGWGRGAVVATGRQTEMGRVAELAGGVTTEKAPLQQGLDQMSRRLAVVVILGAGALMGIGVLRGRDPSEVMEVAVALAIAVVPEGLPAVATLTLAVGMRRMAASNALVRRLPAVETLGATTVVGSDKTGTLTRNRMVVAETRHSGETDPEALWRAAVVCNDADVDPDGEPVGDPTEVALLRAAGENGLDWRRMRETTERDREAPFDPTAKRMAVVIGDTVYIKGAPEALIAPEHYPDLARAADRMAKKGLRTLAIATNTTPGAEASDAALFEAPRVLGVVGLHDPPRETAISAVATLHQAGIRTVMITGDRPDTAEAIARTMDLSQGGVLTGPQLGAMSDGELADAVADTDIFARVDPGYKLRLIRALQAKGEVVAVTGDGVNDAPALTQANVGVAMGSGTDVARESADIVLLDDEYGTIEAAVEEGRRIFANIRRFAQFLFSWHVAEVTVITASLVIGFPPPLSGLMILWNNLVIDVLPSFALALEPSRRDVMEQPPRDPTEPVLSRRVIGRILSQAGLVAAVGLAAFAAGTELLGLGVAAAQTMTFVAMSLGQVLGVFNARSETGSGFRNAKRNPWLWGALALTATLEAAALEIPGLAAILGFAALPGRAWGAAVGLGLLPLALTQAVRILRTRQSPAADPSAP